MIRAFKISDRLADIKPSVTLAVTARAARLQRGGRGCHRFRRG